MSNASFLTLTIILLNALPVQVTFAGNGKIVEGSPNALHVNVYYNYDEADMDLFKEAFEAASELLYCGTDGQMLIGSVRVSKNPAFQDQADFWVLSGTGGATAGGFGVLGDSNMHVTIYEDTHRYTNNDGPLGKEKGQFGIVHESGHHIFDLRNEYHNGAGACCISETSSLACIMDGGTTVLPEHDRTEFCTEHDGGLSTEHVETPITHQQIVNDESCWETIESFSASEYGITMNQPTSETGHTNPTCPTGHTNPAWVVMGDKLRYVICIDKSYSMVGPKMNLAKIAAQLFVDLVHEDQEEYLGVTSFSDDAQLDFSLEEVTSTVPTTKDRAKEAIDSIGVVDMTAMGDGLRLSLDEITDYGAFPDDDACIEAVILLSDGKHNWGSENPDQVIPDLRNRGVMVFTVGLGDPSATTYPLDEDTLKDIADQTGGEYRHAVDEASLSTIYAEYGAVVRGDEEISEETGTVLPGSQGEQTVYVDAYSDETTFLIHWPDYWPEGEDILDLELVMPDGRTIDPYTSRTDPNVVYLETAFYEFYRIKKPEEGTWTLRIIAAKEDYLKEQAAVEYPSKGITYISQVFTSAAGVSSNVISKSSYYRCSTVPVLISSVSAGPPVANASITGYVERPDGSRVPIALYDDGDYYNHRDDIADDGIYSNCLLDFNVDGSYGVTLFYDCTEAIQAIPDEEPFRSDWKPERIKPFTRVSKTSFMIEGVPERLVTPSVKGVDPDEAELDGMLDVRITGGNFVENAMVQISGPGVSVLRSRVTDAKTIEATIRIDADAPAEPRDVQVTNPGGQEDTLPGAFMVIERVEASFFVDDLEIAPTTVLVGESVDISAEVINVGGQLGSYNIALEVNGVTEMNFTAALQPNEQEKISYTYTPNEEGTFSVDINGQTGSFTAIPVVGQVDINVGNMIFDVATLVEGGTVGILVEVTNVGTVEGTDTVTMYIDEAVQGEKAVTLAPGASTIVAFEYSTEKKGTHNVRIGDLTVSFDVRGKSIIDWITSNLGLIAGVVAVVVLALAIAVWKYRLRAT